ncbi:MAG: twin-arginine translocation signal domain-containing protein, partial [Gemmatimonadetes bacterium]|nr:twin-arginine translocation signal domain-containing protein [Gemmatimonadota bacterium]
MSLRSSLRRRDFLKSGLALGAGAAALGRFPQPAGAATPAPGHAGAPLVITSHTNATGA